MKAIYLNANIKTVDWVYSPEVQQALAAKVQTVGVILEQDAISRIENGARMVQDYELRALASQLGKSTDWLLEIEE